MAANYSRIFTMHKCSISTKMCKMKQLQHKLNIENNCNFLITNGGI